MLTNELKNLKEGDEIIRKSDLIRFIVLKIGQSEIMIVRNLLSKVYGSKETTKLTKFEIVNLFNISESQARKSQDDQKKSEDIHPLQKQIGGNHYQGGIQPIEYIRANKLNFEEGSVIKYITRHRKKNGKEDLIKAKHYIDYLLKYDYGEV
jgi:hypothetical protein